MRFRGRTVDPVALWREWCPEIEDEEGPFLSLTYCPNPDHDNTRSPAFQINVSQPMVHCFGHCGISGSYEHAIAVVEGLYEKFNVDPHAPTSEKRKVYRESRRRILRHARLSGESKIARRKGRDNSLKGNRLGKVDDGKNRERLDDLSRFSYLPPVALEYLSGRGISSRVVATFSVGWDASEKRIVLPVTDSRKRTVGLIRRAVRPQDQPKYLYTEGFDRNSLLFGYCELDLGLVESQGLILTEGSFDVLHQHEHGFCNTLGILGSKVSRKQAEIIARINPPRIYLMFDKDGAGIYAIMSAKQVLRKFPLYVCRYPRGKNDPAELSRKESHASVARALPMLKFLRRLPDTFN